MTNAQQITSQQDPFIGRRYNGSNDGGVTRTILTVTAERGVGGMYVVVDTEGRRRLMSARTLAACPEREVIA